MPKKASNAKEKSDGKKENDPKIIYVDRPNKAPRSVEESMARGRPDGAGAQPDADIEKLDSTVTELLGKYQTRGTTKALEDLSKENDRLPQLYQLWWMCIHIVYEIKIEMTEEERYRAIKQLLKYMRQVLIEQLDRRFVLGFVLQVEKLTLVLCDRSGVIMTSRWIDIHS
ncbi:hypothetical protein C0995_004055, partial [Termitomyces sp. Mi166